MSHPPAKPKAKPGRFWVTAVAGAICETWCLLCPSLSGRAAAPLSRQMSMDPWSHLCLCSYTHNTMADNMPTEPILQHEHDLPDIPPEHSPRRHCRKEHVGGSENATPAETDGESDVDDDPEHARQLALETSLRHAERQLEAKPPMDVVEMRHEAHPTGATVATVIAVALLVTATFGFSECGVVSPDGERERWLTASQRSHWNCRAEAVLPCQQRSGRRLQEDCMDPDRASGPRTVRRSSIHMGQAPRRCCDPRHCRGIRCPYRPCL